MKDKQKTISTAVAVVAFFVGMYLSLLALPFLAATVHYSMHLAENWECHIKGGTIQYFSSDFRKYKVCK